MIHQSVIIYYSKYLRFIGEANLTSLNRNIENILINKSQFEGKYVFNSLQMLVIWKFIDSKRFELEC